MFQKMGTSASVVNCFNGIIYKMGRYCSEQLGFIDKILSPVLLNFSSFYYMPVKDESYYVVS